MTSSAEQSRPQASWIASSLRSSQLQLKYEWPFQMNHDAYPDSYIREILKGVKSIAMVRASPGNVRPSYFAFKYLAQHAYKMIPVNHGHVCKSPLWKPFDAALSDIDHPLGMV